MLRICIFCQNIFFAVLENIAILGYHKDNTKFGVFRQQPEKNYEVYYEK